MRLNVKKSSGFTLVEIMIAIAIIGILGAVGSNAYDKQKQRGYRIDAIRTLSELAQKQENWHSKTGAYTSTITDIGSALSDKGKYNITLSNVTTDTYTITAVATGGQLKDTACKKFILEHTGRKTAEKSDSSANTKCWPK